MREPSVTEITRSLETERDVIFIRVSLKTDNLCSQRNLRLTKWKLARNGVGFNGISVYRYVKLVLKIPTNETPSKYCGGSNQCYIKSILHYLCPFQPHQLEQLAI